jgi:hypothetical protein
MEVARRLAEGLVILLSIVVAAVLAWFGGWLVAQEFAREYKDSPYALIGGLLIAIALAISVGLSLGMTGRSVRRRTLAALATLAPILLALGGLFLGLLSGSR